MTTTKENAMALLGSVEAMLRMQATKFARASGGSVDRDDLMQVGRMAALKSAETFDGESSTFKTYAFRMVVSAMKRETQRSRSSVSTVVRDHGRDLSLDAPMGSEEDSATLGDSMAADSATPEDHVVALSQSERVKALLADARAEHSNPALFDDLLNRLMDSYFVAERSRSEGDSVRTIGARHGITGQSVLNAEKRVRATLAKVLAPVVNA